MKILKKERYSSMVTYIYDVIFGYITFLFFEEHSAIVVYKEKAENFRRFQIGVVGLFKRFSHPKFRHPVHIKPMIT